MLLSIDVGLINLAFCIIDKKTSEYSKVCKNKGKSPAKKHDDSGQLVGSDYHVAFWQLLDVTAPATTSILPLIPAKCSHVIKKRECKLKVRYVDKDSLHWCVRHCDDVEKCSDMTLMQRKKIRDTRLQDIVWQFVASLRVFLYNNKETFSHVTRIVIEQQPSNFMKMLAVNHALFAELVAHYQNTIPIDFVSAYHKLDVYDGPLVECTLKTGYARNKFLSKAYTRWFLDNGINLLPGMRETFLSHKKQDDLADSFLQGLVFASGFKKPPRPKPPKKRRNKLKFLKR